MIENYSNVRAVLNELRLALKNLRETGETYSIYIEKTGLTEEEQVEVLETLGRGHITINFNETDQPVEWYESQFSGIWIGTFKNGRDDSILHTVEVSKYPVVLVHMKRIWSLQRKIYNLGLMLLAYNKRDPDKGLFLLY